MKHTLNQEWGTSGSSGQQDNLQLAYSHTKKNQKQKNYTAIDKIGEWLSFRAAVRVLNTTQAERVMSGHVHVISGHRQVCYCFTELGRGQKRGCGMSRFSGEMEER